MTEAAAAAETGQSQPAPVNQRWFWILLALYLLTRLPWIFMVPMVEAPDEFSHFWVLRFLLDHGRLPEAQEVIAGGPSAVYGSLPQLGYLPHVAAGWIGSVIAPAVDISLTDRFGSLLSGIVMLWCSWQFGQRLFAADKILSLALPLMVVFHPQMVLVNAYANCDSVTASLSPLAMLLVCNMLEAGLETKRSIVLGLVMGWLVLTKYTGLAAYPACALGFAMAAWINQNTLKKFIGQAALAAATTAAASAWWFIRTASIFPGDFLGTKTMFHTWAITYHKSLSFDVSPLVIIKQKSWWRFTTFSFWGMFGYMTRYLWRPIYWIYIGFMLMALAGGLKSLAMVAASRQRNNRSLLSLARPATPEAKAGWVRAATWLVLATCFLTNIAMMIYASTKNLGGAQGRYLFPSEIPIIALIQGGLYQFGPRARKSLILLLVAFNIIVYFGAFYMLCPIYGFHFLKTY